METLEDLRQKQKVYSEALKEVEEKIKKWAGIKFDSEKEYTCLADNMVYILKFLNYGSVERYKWVEVLGGVGWVTVYPTGQTAIDHIVDLGYSVSCWDTSKDMARYIAANLQDWAKS